LADRFPFPEIPTGWYVVAASDEIKPGAVIGRHYFERDIAILRTESGEVRVIDAHCPHMGAHLAKVGRVEGERLICGLHGFEYDPDGTCVATAYDEPPPRRARLRNWWVREQNGLVLVWFDALDREPGWSVPALDNEGFTGPTWRRFRIATHPQETTENSVDFGHFTQIHGVSDGSVLDPVKIDGPLLTTKYRAIRAMPLPSWNWFTIPVDYSVFVWGLGYSQVDIHLDVLRQRFRLWILPVPVDRENIDLMVVMSARKSLLPIAKLARYALLLGVCDEVSQDLDVWTYKKFLESPALAKGDGPIAVYRRYAKQFYPDPSVAAASETAIV
jgi:nitrite reductase/ring-hydroxylating ferredoxin subunit